MRIEFGYVEQTLLTPTLLVVSETCPLLSVCSKSNIGHKGTIDHEQNKWLNLIKKLNTLFRTAGTVKYATGGKWTGLDII